MKNKNTEVTLKALLDSGAGASLIVSKYFPTVTIDKKYINWITIAGTLILKVP